LPIHRKKASNDAAAAGFTLLETLVALALAGFLIAALAPVYAANTLRARGADSRLALVAAGRHILEILPGRDDMDAGSRSGSIDGVDWRLRAEALPDAGDPERPIPWVAYAVEIDLVAPNGYQSHISTTRLGRRPGARRR
jgi:prepilin-type N-terminal cleavage/methylation domain-containing protein